MSADDLHQEYLRQKRPLYEVYPSWRTPDDKAVPERVLIEREFSQLRGAYGQGHRIIDPTERWRFSDRMGSFDLPDELLSTNQCPFTPAALHIVERYKLPCNIRRVTVSKTRLPGDAAATRAPQGTKKDWSEWGQRVEQEFEEFEESAAKAEPKVESTARADFAEFFAAEEQAVA